MGITVKRSCPRCAYQKVLQEGAGIRARNLSMIRILFTEEELAEFEKAIQENENVEYEVRNRAGFCKHCKEVEVVTELTYSVKDHIRTIQKKCPKCHETLCFDEKETICPKCGAKMKVQTVGMWD